MSIDLSDCDEVVWLFLILKILHAENFAVFFALRRRVIQVKGVLQRSFSTCVGAAGCRFPSDRKSGCSRRVTRPYRIKKQVQSRVVLAQQTLVRRKAKGGSRDVSGENPSACVPTSRISERYVVDLLLHELNPFRFRYRTSREIPLDVYSAHISFMSARVARNLRAPSPRSHTIMYPNWCTRSLLSRCLIDRGAQSVLGSVITIWTTSTVYLWTRV